MDSFMQVYNELLKLLSGVHLQYNFQLPKIVVVGAQSSGKSSVLESIVGEDFLPRGTDIVTRCPLILQLHTTLDDRVYAVFDHLKDKEFQDFIEVRSEISSRTDALTGSEKKIVSTPIGLSIHSPKVPNLTLVDLPGVTKVDTDDQEEGISNSIEKLVMDNIKDPNTIILAISPANNDIANSDGLQFARKVDPNRERTFGVVTKIDIMDKGTNARDYLNGAKYSLKHGYVGVKCRSQQDNIDGKTISQAIQEEKEFFENDENYSDIADSQGTQYLAKKLSKLLIDRVKMQFPEMEAMISKNINFYKKLLYSLGEPNRWNSETDTFEFLTEAVDKFCNVYTNLFEDGSDQTFNDQLVGGSHIYYIFKHFESKMIDPLDPSKEYTLEQLMIEIRRTYGMNPGLLIPEKAGRNLIKKSMTQFSQPIEICCKAVHETLLQSVDYVMDKIMKSRGALKKLVIETVEKVVESNYQTLKQFVEQYLEAEKSYINYDHADFLFLKPYILKNESNYQEYIKSIEKQFGITSELFNGSNINAFVDEAVNAAKAKIQKTEQQKEEGKVNIKKFNKNNEDVEETIVTETTVDFWSDQSDNESRYVPTLKVKPTIDLTEKPSIDDINNIGILKRAIHSYLAIFK